MACKLEIEDGASKCVHCGTMQNWRRVLGTSGTILSLLVALISVTTVAVPTILDAISSPEPEPNFQFVAPASGNGQIVLSNAGEAPVIFGKAIFYIGAPEDALAIEIVLEITADERLLQPNSAQVFTIAGAKALFDNRREVLERLASGEAICRQDASFNRLNGNIIFLKGNVGCSPLRVISFLD